MTESGKYRGFGREISKPMPEYGHAGADFEYFANERAQLQIQIDRINASLARIKEPELNKDPEVIATFWQKMAPEIERKEKERKGLRPAEGMLDNILEEYEHPDKGMPKAHAYLEEKMKAVRSPDEIAEEIKQIAAERDEIDSNMKALYRNVADAEKHIAHVNKQIDEVVEYLDKDEKLRRLKQGEGMTDKEKIIAVERLMESDKVLALKFKQRLEYDKRKARYEKHLLDYQQLVMDAEKARKAGFRKQAQLKEEYSTALELARAREALEERISRAVQ